MAFLRLVDVLDADFAEAKLDSGIAVVFSGLFLDHDARACFYNSNRDDLAVVIENLSHADFLTRCV